MSHVTPVKRQLVTEVDPALECHSFFELRSWSKTHEESIMQLYVTVKSYSFTATTRSRHQRPLFSSRYSNPMRR